ncbi:S-layer homology domain-containing protein [Bacillus massiliigorillae]|uniref:S-layer homology domain-containing protein n=1 Tax=Bacillus massiliigorillae TaxID=1243664 RepID=UPI000399FDE5|nr:S-layer homology domain-containing protein [Bacillus massiliigorillae]
MKKLPALLLGATMLLSAAPFAQAAPAHTTYKDVPATYTFYQEIENMSEYGVITGFPDGTFRPAQAVTRGQAAIMIGRDLYEEDEVTNTKTKFKDVSPSSAAARYIQKATEDGIITGFPDGTYRPDQSVTRGQMAIFLSRAFDLTKTANVSFKDVSPSSAAYPYIGKLVYGEITAGFPDGTYRPDQAVTRGQFAAFMDRTEEFLVNEAMDGMIDSMKDVTTNGKFDIEKFKKKLANEGTNWDEFLQMLKEEGMTLDEFVKQMQDLIDM